MSFLGCGKHIGGDFRFMILFAVLGVVNFRVHFDKVYYTFKCIFLADGKLYGNRVGVKPFAHHVYGALEISAVDVHFIDVRNAGNGILVRLTPNGFGLGFYAALRAEGCDGAVKDAQRTLYLDGEVNVSRGVDNVYPALVRFGFAASCPMARGSRGRYGNAALLLLNHPVHSSRTVVRFAYFMVDAGIVQDTLGSGCFTCVDMSHYTYISGMQ